MNMVMKTLNISLIFISLLSASETEDYLNFYPLQTNNHWEYRRIKYLDPVLMFPIDSSDYSLNVVGDTLFNNGLNYKILEWSDASGQSTSDEYVRVDTLSGNVYQNLVGNEFLIDSLKAQEGDTIHLLWNWRICVEVDSNDVFFGFNTITKKFVGPVLAGSGGYSLSYQIGKTREWSDDVNPIRTYLMYARINGTEFGTPILKISKPENKSDKFHLYSNYPNPFNSGTTIEFYLPQTAEIKIEIYNLLGQKVRTLWNGQHPAGQHQLRWDGRDDADREVASGVYLFQLKTDGWRQSKKLILIR